MATKQRILIVEDDPDGREVLVRIVEGLGYDTISYGSAVDCLGDIKGKEISLMLLDIMMPEMNGYELMKELKSIPEFQSIPVIMVTAKSDDSEMFEGYKYGADYYIPKPFNSKQIEWGIKTFLD
ncbi:MAG: response regulator [SAR324 cluster bacterium]|uniref:Response regulator n=1 Tax=SAR324 cluster bacterium TaxID=2024889 RepID=A0A7X9FSH8_9DELT|nr:response regulator [SAR324 cluster bacterium]